MAPIQVYKKMLSFYGKQNWWPVTEQGEKIPTYAQRNALSESQRFEIAIGAILTQNTNWKNAEKAIINLTSAKMLDCEKIANSPLKKIALLVKPSGYYNQKAKKIRLFSQYLKKNYSCKTEKMFKKEIPELRKELLSLHGIGNETADSIILYAAQKPVFVIDAYTKRFLERFYAKHKINYVEANLFFESELLKKAPLFNEFHALLVEHAKQYCRKKPLCKACFLKNNCCLFNK